MTIETVLQKAIDLNASDIYVVEDRRLAVRIKQKVTVLEDESLICHSQFVNSIVLALKGNSLVFKELFEPKEMDGTYVYDTPDGHTYYFRYNVGLTNKKIDITFRKLINKVPTAEDIKMHEGVGKKFFNECLKREEGLYLVIGATGSGKSTTLTCIMDCLLKNGNVKAVTLEEPIEYYYKDMDYEPYNSVIIQRAVGFDTKSFDMGLRAAMRQNPDIILVGEIRDKETAASALQAANTGHAVFATLHAAGVDSAVERIRFLLGGITNDFSFVKAVMFQKLINENGVVTPYRECKISSELFPNS